MAKQSPKPKKPSTKEMAFVEEYLTNGFNATHAYRDTIATANSKSRTWGAEGHKYLKRQSVDSYLKQRLAERKEEIHVDQNYVIRKYLEIIESDFAGNTLELTKSELERIPEKARKLIQDIKVSKSSHNFKSRYTGEYETETEEKYQVTFMSKDKALDAIARHTGTFLKDNISLQGNVETKSFTDALKDLDI